MVLETEDGLSRLKLNLPHSHLLSAEARHPVASHTASMEATSHHGEGDGEPRFCSIINHSTNTYDFYVCQDKPGPSSRGPSAPLWKPGAKSADNDTGFK